MTDPRHDLRESAGDLAAVNHWGDGRLPGYLGVRITHLAPGEVTAELEITDHHLAPNGYLHAGTVVSLADTACGYGAVASLPEGAASFTTIELKTNFLATALTGRLVATGTMLHGGRTTQLWDCEVRDAARDRTLAHFRCTQLVVYPKP